MLQIQEALTQHGGVTEVCGAMIVTCRLEDRGNWSRTKEKNGKRVRKRVTER